jgi:hypothetical protein
MATAKRVASVRRNASVATGVHMRLHTQEFRCCRRFVMPGRHEAVKCGVELVLE